MDFIMRFKFTLFLITIFYGMAQSWESSPIGVVPITDYPYLVTVRDLTYPGTFCTGVVLNQKMFLTSARCVYHYRCLPGQLTVHGGSHDTRAEWKYVEKVQRVHIHKEYNEDLQGFAHADLAILLVVNGPEINKKTIDLAPIETSNRVPGYGLLGTVVRWDEYTHQRKTYKRLFAFKVSTTSCRGRWTYDKICARKQKNDYGPCEWDLGTPLIINEVVVGFLNEGWSTCNDKYGRHSLILYTLLGMHQEWINCVIKNPIEGCPWKPERAATRPPGWKPPPGSTGYGVPLRINGSKDNDLCAAGEHSAASHNVFGIGEVTLVTVIVAVRYILLKA